MFDLYMGGVALAAGETNCPGQQAVSTVYEITIEKGAGTEEAIQAVKDAIEKREAFVASVCEAKVLDRGAEAQLAYSCAKSDVKTDELFRSLASLPGVSLQAVTTTTKASSLASLPSVTLVPPSTDISCPLGCKLSSTCMGGLCITCCRIPVPVQRCATGSW